MGYQNCLSAIAQVLKEGKLPTVDAVRVQLLTNRFRQYNDTYVNFYLSKGGLVEYAIDAVIGTAEAEDADGSFDDAHGGESGEAWCTGLLKQKGDGDFAGARNLLLPPGFRSANNHDDDSDDDSDDDGERFSGRDFAHAWLTAMQPAPRAAMPSTNDTMYLRSAYWASKSAGAIAGTTRTVPTGSLPASAVSTQGMDIREWMAVTGGSFEDWERQSTRELMASGISLAL